MVDERGVRMESHPTKTTMKSVEEGNALEVVEGYFDGENLDSCVLIRYLQADNIYRSGGGITAQSNVLKEYKELVDKVYVPAF